MRREAFNRKFYGEIYHFGDLEEHDYGMAQDWPDDWEN